MFPATAHIWDLRIPGGYLSADKIVTRKRLACVAAKYLGEDEPMHFFAEWLPGGHEEMVRGIWQLLDECDGVVHFNGLRADEPWLNTEFVLLGLDQPVGYKSVDLYRAVRRKFAFMSNGLAYVTKELGVRNKTDSGGMETLVAAMNGDQDARDHLGEYCKNDVLATEELFWRLRSWIPSLPNAALYEGVGFACPGCAGSNLIKRGVTRTAAGVYQRYQCNDCHRWSRGRKNIGTTELRPAV
jgi:hypothetical protein